jgi:hypothetical protein
MRDSTALPNLQMLPTGMLVPHEDYDPRRIEKLSQRLQGEGILKNPPIAATIPGDTRYVVLDGANRVISFSQLGIPHIVAQLVSYDDPGISLDTWYHVVSGMPLGEFEDELAQVAGMQLMECTLHEARQALESEEAMAYIITQDGVRKVPCPSGCQPHDLGLLNALVGAYKGKADIYRASNDSWELQAPTYPRITALVIFPRYHPQDILQAAQRSYHFPSGITRHVIPNRALNINIPLEILAADWTLEQKRQWLQDWLMERLAANAIRYYAEPTFSFNE